MKIEIRNILIHGRIMHITLVAGEGGMEDYVKLDENFTRYIEAYDPDKVITEKKAIYDVVQKAIHDLIAWLDRQVKEHIERRSR
jgi:hypothetical protein